MWARILRSIQDTGRKANDKCVTTPEVIALAISVATVVSIVMEMLDHILRNF